jgi:hypothetical protein
VASTLSTVEHVPSHHSSGPVTIGASTPPATSTRLSAPPPPPPSSTKAGSRVYPWHHDIVSTTFWVGEIFTSGPNGSQVISTYDDRWLEHYGGCDGVMVGGDCRTETRTAANGYFPLHMTPRQNPFYLDLPYDDVNDPTGAAERGSVIPWAHDPAYRDVLADPDKSLMKNRWVEIRRGDRVCYGQIEDAGPGQYHDAAYVFGTARPANSKYNGAGMDVSPALNGCLHFAERNGDSDVVDWRFVEAASVPDGPWMQIVTRT